MIAFMRLAPRLLGATLLAALVNPACAREAPQTPATPAAPASASAPRPASGATLPDIRLAPAFPRLSFTRPVLLTHAGDGSGRLFVIEQPGRIRVFENRTNVEKAEVFLDIRDRVNDGTNEEGLLALAFHPQFTTNHLFYVYYTAANPRRGVLSRFMVSTASPDRADAATEQVILEVEQPYWNHNGSTVLFGPEGFLYYSLGDGGAANDPHRHGQNLGTLLAKILRIDVDKQESGRPYAIPADNPFVKTPGARPEIWALGLRNVWRMSFDRVTGQLWAGDVGQNRFEEINLIVKGGNYGWNVREGAHPFAEGASATEALIDPVVEYPRNLGISVTGGHVYRGKSMSGLQGAYIYGDYVSGRIWGLRYEDGRVTAQREILGESRRPSIASFGEDAEGELYTCSFDKVDARRVDGRIFRLVSP